jgi:hypothetical protein
MLGDVADDVESTRLSADADIAASNTSSQLA